MSLENPRYETAHGHSGRVTSYRTNESRSFEFGGDIVVEEDPVATVSNEEQIDEVANTSRLDTSNPAVETTEQAEEVAEEEFYDTTEEPRYHLRPRPTLRQPVKFNDYVCAKDSYLAEPTSYREANPLKAKWSKQSRRKSIPLKKTKVQDALY